MKAKVYWIEKVTADGKVITAMYEYCWTYSTKRADVSNNITKEGEGIEVYRPSFYIYH